MKRWLMLLSIVLLSQAAASGQEASVKSPYAGITISLPVVSFYYKPEATSTTVGLSAAFFYHFRNRFWIEGEVSTWEHQEIVDDATYKLRSYVAAGYLDLFTIKRIGLTPYLGTGLFLFQAGSGTSNSELIYRYYGYFDWEYVPGLLLGGGLRWQILDTVGARLDIRNNIGTKAWAYEPDNHIYRLALSVIIRTGRNRGGR